MTQTESKSKDCKVRVGFCLHAMQVAGAEVLVTQIIDRLKNQIDPTVFCLDSIGKLGEELLSQGVPVVLLDRRPGLDAKVPRKLALELSSRAIQIVHAHQYTPFFYSALARLQGALSTKIMMTEHGRHYPDVVSAKRRWINRLFLSRLASHSTACCGFSAKALEKNDGFSNVEVLYNGIDATTHPERKSSGQRAELRAKLGMAPHRIYITCIARFHPVKDHCTLIRAFALLQKQIPDSKLLLVGSGPQEDSLKALVDQLGIDHAVEFWGVRRDISDILQASDVFSLTSLSEAASLTLLEAMANGCPVAITDVGGNGEHITHGVHGLLSPRGDAPALAANFRKIIEDYPSAERMAQAARERVSSEFRLAAAVERYAELYRSLTTR
jgi:glycosyltransferase involved in cell wall biosynthesis